MDTTKEAVSSPEQQQSKAIDSHSDNSNTTQGGDHGHVDPPSEPASSNLRENPSTSAVKSADSPALTTQQQPPEIKGPALTEHESVSKDSASEKSSAGDTTVSKAQSDFRKDAGTTKIEQDSRHGVDEMALSASSKLGQDATPSKSTRDGNTPPDTTPDTTPKSVGFKLRKKSEPVAVANQLDLDDTTESSPKAPASKESKSSLAADVPQPITPVANPRGPKRLQLDEASSMPEASATKSQGPKTLATDKTKKTGVSTPALSSPKRTHDAAGMAASLPAKKMKYDTIKGDIERPQGNIDGMKASGKKNGTVGSAKKPARLDNNAPPAPHVVLHFSSGFTTRVARQFLKDHTKLLDDDPNAFSINLSAISQDEFSAWRNVILNRNGLPNAPWRSYEDLIWKLLIADEKINGRWWKTFMDKEFEGLNSVVNARNLLHLRAVAYIGDATDNMPSSQLFTWACNGLHHIYQRQGRTYEWVKHRLANYMPESTSAGAKRRIKARFQVLEDTYGGEDQASAGLHPGHRSQAPPEGIPSEYVLYAESQGIALEKAPNGKDSIWRRPTSK